MPKIILFTHVRVKIKVDNMEVDKISLCGMDITHLFFTDCTDIKYISIFALLARRSCVFFSRFANAIYKKSVRKSHGPTNVQKGFYYTGGIFVGGDFRGEMLPLHL